MLWDHLQHLPHHLDVSDVVVEETQVSGKPGDAVREIFRVLASFHTRVPKSRFNCCTFASCTRWTPMWIRLIASHADTVDVLLSRRPASILASTERNIVASARRSWR
jgi:hypothetical protein